MTRPAANRYRSFPKIDLADRQWPGRSITAPPIWMSTDLRDGNQALFEPMNVDRKMRLFHTLCDIGFKEIEVAFPSASQTEFDLVRNLIEGGHIPDDVTIEVLTQAREHLVRRTMESLRGAKRAIVHVYNATSRPFREFVFGMSKTEVIDMAVSAVKLIRELAAKQPETQWTLEYSPENFTATELDFALEVCDAVTAAWGATPKNKVILNLPATVELATPNIYADQIEWMHRHLARRDSVILSLHPHNDRGTAVAAAELALMAGADRVEGCLFGNGERTGNVDIVTLALNLHTQGVDSGLDFSDINAIARTTEECTQLPIHPRHPYVGDLVFTAFSGSHQDAIKKGFAAQQPDALWNVPYLPVDPADVGRNYDSIIRINSQSGKGGITYLLEADYGLELPRRLQIEFSTAVQAVMDVDGRELNAADIWALFEREYRLGAEQVQLERQRIIEHEDGLVDLSVSVRAAGRVLNLQGKGAGPVAAFVDGLQRATGCAVAVLDYHEHSIGSGAQARAAAYLELRIGDTRTLFGVGIDANILTASMKAVTSGLLRCGIALDAAATAG